jgi:hypothetical protein
MEYEVGGEFIESNVGGDKNLTLLYITRWLNLGSGISPNDLIWQCHISDQDRAPIWPSFEEGGIRNAFEGAGDISFEEFTKENKKRLLSYENSQSPSFPLFGQFTIFTVLFECLRPSDAF